MKRFFAIFVLTPAEQHLVIFIVLAIVIGAWIKHHREMDLNNPPERGSEPSPIPLVSPLDGQQS